MALRLLAHRRDAVVLDREFGDANVVLFDPRPERSFESVLNRLRMADLSLPALDLLVLRASHGAARDDIEHDAVLADYLEGVPVLALTGSHDAAAPAPALWRPSWATPSTVEPLALAFRGPEFEALLRRSSAVFHHQGCHYDLPSAAVHAETFIRLADALQDATDLVRAADWLLPLLGERCGLAADTGSLLGLMATARDEALRRFGWEVPLATLDRYPRGQNAVEALIDNFAVAGWHRLVFLISVNSTGAVARYVRQRVPEASVVALCETGMAEGQRADAGADEAQTFVEHPVERWALDEQRRCERCHDLDLLHVHPETYEITADLKWTPVSVDLARVAAERPFWEVANRTDAVALHVDRDQTVGAREQVRHLSISLDIAALLSDEAFFAQSLAVVKERFPRPDVVLIPDHAAADALRRLAEAAWDAPVFLVPVGPLPADVRAAVHGADDVLVMDDVVITSQTLFGLRTRIYEASRQDGEGIRVWGFVVVARTERAEAWRRIRQRYMAKTEQGMRSSLFAVQELVLPPPGARHCPWCRERDLLQRTVGSLSGAARVTAIEREGTLRRTPLVPPLGIGGAGPDVLTKGAMIGDLRPAAAFAASASLAQFHKDQLDGRRQAAEIFYFDTDLLVAAIFDAAMFGGFLRTFDPRNVRDPTRDAHVAARLLDKPWDAGMLAELAIGAAEAKLPAETVLRCLDAATEVDEGTAGLLRALVERA